MSATSSYTPKVFKPIESEAPLSELQETIIALKQEHNAVILAHNYQIDSIQRIADYVGDSLGLCYQAAKTDADVILFAGVHFMAETAKLLNPGKKVLIPDMDAGCSLADACPADTLKAYLDKNPELYVVAYVNCSAGVKALSDVTVTSGNAVDIISKIPEDKEILFVPDQNLGQWVASQTGRKMRLWPGSCYAHVLFSARALEKVALEYPDSPIVAHPECVQEVRNRADVVCSTEKMVGFCKDHAADSFIILTESGMINRLRREIPGKTFIAGPTDRCACNDCRFMKLNTLEKIKNCLVASSPELLLSEEIIEQAKKPIELMLEWSKKPAAVVA